MWYTMLWRSGSFYCNTCEQTSTAKLVLVQVDNLAASNGAALYPHSIVQEQEICLSYDFP
jgi:hypothetical protein